MQFFWYTQVGTLDKVTFRRLSEGQVKDMDPTDIINSTSLIQQRLARVSLPAPKRRTTPWRLKFQWLKRAPVLLSIADSTRKEGQGRMEWKEKGEGKCGK